MKALLLLLVLFFFVQAEAQKPEEYYPVVRTTPFYYMTMDTVQCLSGDCKEGEGTLVAQIYRNLLYEQYLYRTRVLKGRFSEEGRKFTGKIYHFETIFVKGVPRDSIDFSTDNEKVRSTLIAEGEAIRQPPTKDWAENGNRYFKVNYLLHGKAKDLRYLKVNKHFKDLEGIYDNGLIKRAEITFRPGSTVKKFTGMVRADYEPLAGKTIYSDNSTYEGFYFESHFHGPGKYIPAGKPAQEGIWWKGELIEKREVPFPTAFFSLQPQAYSGTPHEYVLGYKLFQNVKERTYKGLYSGKLVNGLPEGNGLIVSDSQFFYSRFKEGQAAGKSFFLNLDWPYNAMHAIDVSYEQIYYGMLENHWITSGTIIQAEIQRSKSTYKDRDTTTLWQAKKVEWTTGSFVKHSLEGCGQYKVYFLPQGTGNTSWAYDVTGKFEKGSHVGWVRVVVPDSGYNNFFKKSGLAYVERNAPYGRDLLNRDEMTFASLRAAINDTTGCGLVSADEKKEYLEKARVVLGEISKREPEPLVVKDPCADKKEMFPIKMLTFFGNGTSKPVGVVVSYDCQSGKYRFVQRHWVEPRKTFFKTNDNVGYYYFTEKFLTQGEIASSYNQLYEKYTGCSECKGTGVNYVQVVHTRGNNRWEQTYVPNLYVYVPEHVIASWDERQACKKCYQQGWVIAK